ncbi:integrase catalytic domain-containing protein [Trichonephila clavata]|uniref:Integrase catalytic domain-containing protein n=1 Tax=Trichonephila clavata TaxID=2740835 RepID=A0A8X6EX91_TRICU|nr:integrase catalytic domain-containing protein [Trichonephila clavata]
MCTKAVHLELVSSLSAAAFLSALRRFVSRRGYPSDIYSDNGTNFVGASAYLKDLFKLLHNSNVKDYSSSKNIQWHFIPPYAPNFGGVWEASVKLTKHRLLKTLKAAVLNFEELATILCQIEACINSRPLYPLSSEPKDHQVHCGERVLDSSPTENIQAEYSRASALNTKQLLLEL